MIRLANARASVSRRKKLKFLEINPLQNAMKKIISLLLLFVFTVSTFAQTMPAGADPKIWARAVRIHKKAIIVDGHNDIPSPMVDDDFDLAMNSVGKFHNDGDPFHTDLDRFKRSGITGEFFSIFVSSSYASGGSMRRAMDLIDATYREVEKHPAQLMLCTTSAQIRQAKRFGKVCALMGIEGGHAIEDSLYALRDFYRLGVRYMTLTWNNTNNWADACCSEAKHGGLSDFGKEVVKEMNRLGMLVDISHVSDDTMNDVLDTSTAPVIYSHSSARKFSDHRRNVPDAILKRVAQNKGVVMINFYPAFLDQRYLDESRARDQKLRTEITAIRDKYKHDRDGLNTAMRALYAANPIYVPSYTVIVDHIDHVKQVAGIDYVGIGSDFDGVPLLPEPMQGMEDLVLVTYEMLRRGYTEQEVLKVLGGNFMRVFAAAEKVAKGKISGDGKLKKIK
jgi:membrane dipeptidase